MIDADLLLLFSEWLDVQGLMVDPDTIGDLRSHEALVVEFLASRHA